MPRDRLLALCSPATLEADDPSAKNTLERWLQLGAFREAGGEISLLGELGTEAADDLEVLRTRLLHIALRPKNNARILEVDGEGADLLSGSSDFTRATCWCLLQDPYTFTSSFRYVESRQNEQEIVAVQNPNRWAGFTRWSTFLGVAMKTPKGLLLNPAFAVRDALDRVIPDKGTMELGPFLDRLASEVPVLPGGPMSLRVAAKLKAPWRVFARHEVAPTTALALMQLQEGGLLQLSKLSDADVRLFLGRGGKVLEEFTHVERTA